MSVYSTPAANPVNFTDPFGLREWDHEKRVVGGVLNTIGYGLKGAAGVIIGGALDELGTGARIIGNATGWSGWDGAGRGMEDLGADIKDYGMDDIGNARDSFNDAANGLMDNVPGFEGY